MDTNGAAGPFSAPPQPAAPSAREWAVSVFLFIATALTTTTLGAVWSIAVRTDATTSLLPWLSASTIRAVWSDPRLLATGLSFSLPTMAIMLAHELGHLVACRHYRIRASLPYFLPLPMALGTLGAFIRIRERIRTRKQVFDIGLAGPFAGFAVLIPFLLVGAARSSYGSVELATEPTGMSLVQPGVSPLMHWVLAAFHGPLPAGRVVDLDPMALAAWVGLLVTCLNLLPLGQLDGGHALYALSPRRYPLTTRVLWVGLLIAGFWWPGWWVWAFLTALMRLRHPPVIDPRQGLDTGRRWIAVLAAVVFVLCWMPVPIASIDIVP